MPDHNAKQESPEQTSIVPEVHAGRSPGIARPNDAFQCAALATDYDGTIATHGAVDEDTRAALLRFRSSGRRLILVTGRRIDDLSTMYPQLADFDVIVAENGAVLYWPGDQREEPLGEPPPPEFIRLLVKADVRPIERGRVIVATYDPYHTTVLDAIKELGLELQVIFNKGAVMILPSGINKATGLRRALKAFGIRPEDVAGVGDAENDHALLDLCGFSAAVANALPALKARARCVLSGSHGKGVQELIEVILEYENPNDRRGWHQCEIDGKRPRRPKESAFREDAHCDADGKGGIESDRGLGI